MAPKPETKTLIEMSYCIVTRQSQTHFNVSNCEGFSFTNFYFNGLCLRECSEERVYYFYLVFTLEELDSSLMI